MNAIGGSLGGRGIRRRLARIARRSPTRWHWIAGTAGIGTVTVFTAAFLTGTASGSGTSHTEHFRFMSTSVPDDKFNVIATGMFTDGGTATPLGPSNKLTFPDGTIDVASKSKGKPVANANTKTCYETLFDQGTYTITGGTGKYRGITGSGTYSLEIREIGPKVNGKCDTQTSKRVASQAILKAYGPVTLG